jgi:hypothetical protein
MVRGYVSDIFIEKNLESNRNFELDIEKFRIHNGINKVFEIIFQRVLFFMFLKVL